MPEVAGEDEVAVVADPPVEPTPAPTPEPGPEPTPEPTPEPEPPAEGEPEPVPPAAAAPKSDWKDRRIAKLTARLREREAAPAPVAPGPEQKALVPGTPEFEAEVERRAATRASQEAAAIQFGKDCEATAKAGKAAYADFDDRVNNLKQVYDPTSQDEVVAYNTFLALAIETGEGAKIIHQLGGDLDEAQRILALSPTKMAMELTKMATGAGPKREVSQTPKPITPIRPAPSSMSTIDPRDPSAADRLSTAEWMKRREEQVAAQNPRRRA